MPGFDRTGPRGLGPMTGRGMGCCGRGMRRGYGRGYGYNAPITEKEEKEMLEEEIKALQKRIKELGSK
jgi:hypothetical protein